MLAVALSVTGVSFRFGDTCHINHDKALADFWGPLLAVAGVAMALQFGTLGYCTQVFLRALMDDGATTDNSSGLPHYTSSIRTTSARQAYRRVRKVIGMQWRGILVVIVIISDVVFFSVVFVTMDNTTQAAVSDLKRAEPWLLCLVLSGGDKNACLDKAAGLVIKEATVMAVLVMLSVSLTPNFLETSADKGTDERLVDFHLLWPVVYGHRLDRAATQALHAVPRIRLRRRAPLLQRPAYIRNARETRTSELARPTPFKSRRQLVRNLLPHHEGGPLRS